jgi:hypothetical protein
VICTCGPTLDPVIHFAPSNRFNPYIIGSDGIYHRTVEFTATTIATVTGFDRFFGFFPVNVPANQVLASNSVYKPGFDGGVKLFAEARYHYMYTAHRGTSILPVTFGIRW